MGVQLLSLSWPALVVAPLGLPNGKSNLEEHLEEQFGIWESNLDQPVERYGGCATTPFLFAADLLVWED
jgi:hypothetical protein